MQKDDPDLYDNAKGFSNFAAPGADRLKIELVLTKKLYLIPMILISLKSCVSEQVE